MSSSAQLPLVPSLKNILFATDFSLSSEAAIPCLCALALASGALVHVVHVLGPEARAQVPMDEIPELDARQSEAEEAMRSLLDRDAFKGITHTATVEHGHGHVWEILAALVEVKHIDLIVQGSHGRRGLKKLVLGSTAEQVIRMATCPVLTIGPHAGCGAKQASLGPIVFATDFSSSSHRALHDAASLARANHVRLILLHAVPPSMEVPPATVEAIPVNPAITAELITIALENARRRMKELISSEKLDDLDIETIVEGGPPEDMILAAAENKKASLIVMGAHRAWMRSVVGHLPWATATAILCEAPCPVMTVRD